LANLTLNNLATTIGGQLSGAAKDLTVSGVSDHNEKISAGDIFVAVRGDRFDGHSALDHVFNNGAVAAVVEDASALGDRPGIVVTDSRRAIGVVASLVFGEPTKLLRTIGVTGTNGKTTTVWMVSEALHWLGSPSLRVGTLGISGPGQSEDTLAMTTPGALQLHRCAASAVKAGAENLVMEVSSHGLVQGRLAGIEFDVAGFTNLSSDHLNYHLDLQDYFEAKQQLFRQWRVGQRTPVAVINVDNRYGSTLVSRLDTAWEVLCCGEQAYQGVRISAFEQSAKGSVLELELKGSKVKIRSSFLGRFNAANLALAAGILHSLGIDPTSIRESLEKVSSVPGRLEPVLAPKGTVFIDYAHTPDALENVLKALQDLPHSALWVIFGCGGHKDPGRRWGMGEVAARYADHIVLTSDNPRNEDPDKIVADILKSGCRPTIIEPDRAKAISEVLQNMGEGDIVLVAGKGHESYQIVGDTYHHYSDRSEVLQAIRRLGVCPTQGTGF